MALESRTTSKESHLVWREGVGKVPPQAATRRLSTLPHARFLGEEIAAMRSPYPTHRHAPDRAWPVGDGPGTPQSDRSRSAAGPAGADQVAALAWRRW